MPSVVSAELIEAYRATDYRIRTESGEIVLRIDEASPGLLDLHDRLHVRCSAVITAFNPHSQPTHLTANSAAMMELKELVTVRGWPSLPAVGTDPRGIWPGEPSVLVLGISEPEAMELGNRFHQNAIVWAGPDARPRLLLLR
jgi:Protein of unknown function (DUF3293)